MENPLKWYVAAGRDAVDLPTYRRTVRKILQRRGWTMTQWRMLDDNDQMDELAWEFHLVHETFRLLDLYKNKNGEIKPEIHALFMMKLHAL